MQSLKNVMVDRSNHLKATLSGKFQEWRELLTQMEQQAHNLVD
jgi:hypothetical protein